MLNQLKGISRRTAIISTAVLALGSVTPIATQANPKYPTKTITIVVPFPAGAGTDIVARTIAEKLGKSIGEAVIVENRAGAAGIIGTTYVSKAAPDGYTLLFTPNSISFAHLMTGSAKPPYNPVEGFKPVIEVCKTPVFLVAGPKSGAKTFQEAAAIAKKSNSNFGSAGNGSVTHLIGEAVNQSTGIGFSHVPYKGTSQAMVDLIGGHIDFAYASMSTIEPHLISQTVRVLATTGATRSSLAPNVPSIAELGYSGVNLGSWYGIFAPKGTSDEVVSMLNEHIEKILKMPDVIETMKKQGSTAVGGPASVLDRTNKTDTSTYQKLIADLKISPI